MDLTAISWPSAIAAIFVVLIVAVAWFNIVNTQQQTIREKQAQEHEKRLLDDGYRQVPVRVAYDKHESGITDDMGDKLPDRRWRGYDDELVWRKKDENFPLQVEKEGESNAAGGAAFA